MIALDEIDDPELLRKHAQVLVGFNEYLQKRNKELADELARLKLRHKVFGDSSERRISPHPPGGEPPQQPAARTGHGPTPQLRLPTREEHHRLNDDQRKCPVCEKRLEEMGEVTEDAEEVTVEERRFVVVKHRRHKYRCRCNGAVKTAPGPLRLIPGGRYSIDFAVALEIDKRLNHLPLDRQRRQMAREGLEISTQTMWDQEDALAELLEPSYLKLLDYVLGADVIGADETHWRLMQPGSSKKWWVWCLTTDDAAWYMLEPSRSAETIGRVLGEFEGIVMCDAYGAYGSLAKASEGRLRLAHCFAHARRKFFEIRNLYPEPARQAIDMIDALFLIERALPSADIVSVR